MVASICFQCFIGALPIGIVFCAGVFINMALSGDVKKTDMHASDTYSLGATGQLLTNRNRDAMKGNSNDMASFDEDLTQEDADEMEALKAVKSWKKNFG